MEKQESKSDLKAYYRDRVAHLSERLFSTVEELFDSESVQRQHEFEDHVERQLRNGAKFIPRKQQPR